MMASCRLEASAWPRTGAFAGGNPITVSNNQAVLASGATGQDAYKAFTSVVDPTDPVLTNNTVYTSANWTFNEPTTVAAANLRIGSSTTTPGVAIDSIQVQVIPEPGTPALIGLGVLSLLRRVRRI